MLLIVTRSRQFLTFYHSHFLPVSLHCSAARNSQKGSYKDKRDLVTYDEELFWFRAQTDRQTWWRDIDQFHDFIQVLYVIWFILPLIVDIYIVYNSLNEVNKMGYGATLIVGGIYTSSEKGETQYNIAISSSDCHEQVDNDGNRQRSTVTRQQWLWDIYVRLTIALFCTRKHVHYLSFGKCNTRFR